MVTHCAVESPAHTLPKLFVFGFDGQRSVRDIQFEAMQLSGGELLPLDVITRLVERLDDLEGAAATVGDPQRVAVLAQTTLAQNEWSAVLDQARERFPEGRKYGFTPSGTRTRSVQLERSERALACCMVADRAATSMSYPCLVSPAVVTSGFEPGHKGLFSNLKLGNNLATLSTENRTKR